MFLSSVCLCLESSLSHFGKPVVIIIIILRILSILPDPVHLGSCAIHLSKYTIEGVTILDVPSETLFP